VAGGAVPPRCYGNSGSRNTITRLAADQDAVFSFEGGGKEGNLRLATSGIGAVYLTVTGKTSHAGGGTDATFAGLKARGAVVEGMGLSGFGAHSNAAEYVQVETIVPRLYLAARMIMDMSRGKVPLK